MACVGFAARGKPRIVYATRASRTRHYAVARRRSGLAGIAVYHGILWLLHTWPFTPSSTSSLRRHAEYRDGRLKPTLCDEERPQPVARAVHQQGDSKVFVRARAPQLRLAELLAYTEAAHLNYMDFVNQFTVDGPVAGQGSSPAVTSTSGLVEPKKGVANACARR